MKFYVSESIRIQKSVEEVFPLIADLRRWSEWSPWLRMEPDVKQEYFDDGCRQTWEGQLIGSGELERIACEAGQSCRFALRFLKPMRSTAETQLSLKAFADGAVEVRWEMFGTLPFFLFFLKKMMIALIGSDYRRGLTMLKDLAETGEVVTAQTMPDFTSFQSMRVLTEGSERCGMTEIGERMSAAFETVERKRDALATDHAQQEGWTAVAVYHDFDLVGQVCSFSCGLVPPGDMPAAVPPTETLEIAGGTAMRLEHTGEYKFLGNAWSAAFSGLRQAKKKPRKKLTGLEIYHCDPRTTPASQRRTEVLIPLR